MHSMESRFTYIVSPKAYREAVITNAHVCEVGSCARLAGIMSNNDPECCS